MNLSFVFLFFSCLETVVFSILEFALETAKYGDKPKVVPLLIRVQISVKLGLR